MILKVRLWLSIFIGIVIVLGLIFILLIQMGWHIDNDTNKVELQIHLYNGNDTAGCFMLLPVFITEDNETIFKIDEYKFKKGSGNISIQIVNGTRYLNISLESSYPQDEYYYWVEIYAKTNKDFKGKVNVDGFNMGLIGKEKVKVYFSGNDAFFGYGIEYYFGKSHTTLHIINNQTLDQTSLPLEYGWNEVSIKVY